MRPRALFALIVLASLWGTACRHPVTPDDPRLVQVNGTVRFLTIEGGFWAVRGDDEVTYDPAGGLPPAFQSDGLRVRLEGRRRDDLASVHMAGPILEITSISRLP